MDRRQSGGDAVSTTETKLYRHVRYMEFALTNENGDIRAAAEQIARDWGGEVDTVNATRDYVPIHVDGRGILTLTRKHYTEDRP
jgi:hypothetical protein